jgi:uroporphyrinogen-III synthase
MAASAGFDHVLLTRPEGGNEKLADMLEAQGYQVTVQPLIKLLPLDPTPALKQAIIDLDYNDKIIFISKGSVRFGMPLLEDYWPQWPAALAWFAVGSGTANALREYQTNPTYPDVAGSEGLLMMAEMGRVAGETILIVRGIGGRELLATELRNRGASVRYLEVYSREAISAPGLSLPASSQIVVTSLEILETLIEQFSGRIKDCDVVVVSARLEEHALSAGFKRVKNAAGASDQALYDAVLRAK